MREYEFQDCFLLQDERLQEEREPHMVFHANNHHHRTAGKAKEANTPISIEILAGEQGRSIVPTYEEESKQGFGNDNEIFCHSPQNMMMNPPLGLLVDGSSESMLDFSEQNNSSL